MKLTHFIPAYIYAIVEQKYNPETFAYEDIVKLVIRDSDKWEDYDPHMTPVGVFQIPFEIDTDLMDPKRLRHSALMREKQNIVEEYTKKLADVQERITQFLTLEHTPQPQPCPETDYEDPDGLSLTPSTPLQAHFGGLSH